MEVEASDLLTGDPAAIADLPDDLLTLREDLAQTVGWFETAEEHNLFLSFRAFNMAAGIVADYGDAELLAAWNTFWDAEQGSIEEAYAAVETQVGLQHEILDRLDEALAATQP